jgi:lysophospholipase L1-like esterase
MADDIKLIPWQIANNVAGIGTSKTQRLINVINDETSGKRDVLYYHDGINLQVISKLKPERPQLPVNSRIIHFGDSQTFAGMTTLSTVPVYYYWGDRGFTSWLQQLMGHKLYVPLNGNKGVNGETTTQMIARLGSALALAPKVVTILGGTNDISASVPATTIIANLNYIYNAFRSIGCKILAIPILPRYAGNALSATQEAERQKTNAWILQQASPDIIPITGTDAMFPDSTWFFDGLHLVSKGAYKLGLACATEALKLVEDVNVSRLIQADNALNTGMDMAGTGGSLAGTATGQVATGWTLSNAGSHGATVVGSKSVDANGYNQQRVDISGTYNAASSTAYLVQQIAISNIYQTDVLEAIAEVELLNVPVGIGALQLVLAIVNSGFTNLATSESMENASVNVDDSPLVPGKYIFRTPVMQIPTGAPAFMQLFIQARFKDTAVSVPVSLSMNITRVAVRKVPADLQPTPNQYPQIRREVIDAAVSITAADFALSPNHLVAIRTMTAPHACTIPAANTVPGMIIEFKDEPGVITATNKLTSTTTIDGVANADILAAAFAGKKIYSNGTQWCNKP